MIAISGVLNTDNIRLRRICFLFATFYVRFILCKLWEELLFLWIFFILLNIKEYGAYGQCLYAPLL